MHFFDSANKLATQHMQENLDDYVKGKITARERRILFTKWVGQAWEEISSMKAMIKRSFVKAGIAVAIDGSQDSEINIDGLADYSVDSDDDSSDDPFQEEDSEADDNVSSCSEKGGDSDAEDVSSSEEGGDSEAEDNVSSSEEDASSEDSE